jgi:hypothetical protein
MNFDWPQSGNKIAVLVMHRNKEAQIDGYSQQGFGGSCLAVWYRLLLIHENWNLVQASYLTRFTAYKQSTNNSKPHMMEAAVLTSIGYAGALPPSQLG